MAAFGLTLSSVLLAAACGATTRGGGDQAGQLPVLTSATVTFSTLEDGKDARSAVTAQLLRNRNELGAELHSAGTEFDDNSVSAPLAMSTTGSFSAADLQSGQLRVRLAPDGKDTWTFNLRLALAFSDNTQRTYAWSAVRLDEMTPERTFSLAGSQVP